MRRCGYRSCVCSVAPTIVGKILFQQRGYTSLLRKRFDKTYTRGPVGREDGSREDIHFYFFCLFREDFYTLFFPNTSQQKWRKIMRRKVQWQTMIRCLETSTSKDTKNAGNTTDYAHCKIPKVSSTLVPYRLQTPT